MNATQILAARLTEVEKATIRGTSATEDAMRHLYSRYQAELPGGNLLGGTVEEGMVALQEVVDTVNTQFAIDSQNPTFGRTWLF